MINSFVEVSFDRIEVVEGSDAGQVYTIDMFLEIPVHTRVKMIMGRLIEFKRGGVVVDRKTALSELRQVSANRTLTKK